MAAAKKAPARKKPRLAFAGVSLEIPAKLPGSWSMDMVELSAVDDGESRILYRAVTSVIGEDGWEKVRDAQAKKQLADGGTIALGDLLTAINKVYGLEEGK
jgi:hypothetical protein